MVRELKKTSKNAARKLLTKFINEIALEQHDEAIMVDREAVCVTKAEALARLMWKNALGWIERVDIVDKKSGIVLGVKEIYHSPDKIYVTMLYDRMEGKVAPVEPEKADAKVSVAEKVSREGKNRLNSMAKK